MDDISHLSNFDVVKCLVSNGASMNTQNSIGDNVLHKAAYGGNLETVQYHILKGADIHHKNNKGNTPLYLAWENEHLEIVKYLVMNGSDPNQLNNEGLSPQQITSLSLLSNVTHLPLNNYSQKK